MNPGAAATCLGEAISEDGSPYGEDGNPLTVNILCIINLMISNEKQNTQKVEKKVGKKWKFDDIASQMPDSRVLTYRGLSKLFLMIMPDSI